MTYRSLAALSLSLLIALTAMSFGAARGQAQAAGQMVLCQNGVAVDVAVDADGTPVGPVHLCPDCVMGQLAAVPVGAPLLTRAEGPCLALAPVPVVLSVMARAPAAALPRGPPIRLS